MAYLLIPALIVLIWYFGQQVYRRHKKYPIDKKVLEALGKYR